MSEPSDTPPPHNDSSPYEGGRPMRVAVFIGWIIGLRRVEQCEASFLAQAAPAEARNSEHDAQTMALRRAVEAQVMPARRRVLTSNAALAEATAYLVQRT